MIDENDETQSDEGQKKGTHFFLEVHSHFSHESSSTRDKVDCLRVTVVSELLVV
jgi:hypothetical protein